MTGWNIKLRQRSAKILPRDMIVLVITTVLLLIFVTKAVQFSLIGNLQILAISMAIVGIVSIGETLVILTGGVDLSVGSLMALTGVITAYLTTQGLGTWLGPFNPWVAAGIGLLIATGVGWLHGVLISRFQLAPFIVTFGSLSLLRGLAQVISNGSSIDLHGNAYGWLWNNVFGIIPVPAILMALLFIGVAYMLRNTRIGRYTYAIGSNDTVARLSGVNVGRTQQIIYATSGFLAGIAGLLLLARIEGGSFTSGENYELLAIAAVIIGGTSLKGGTGGVWGTLAGVLLMSLVSNGLVLLSVPPLWKEAITGAIIMAAALIDVQRRRLQESVPTPVRTLSLPTIEPSMTLADMLKQLTRTIQDHFGYDEVRVCLRDRETGDLVEPATHATPSGTLAQKVNGNGKSIFYNDLRREKAELVIPWQPECHSAAAIPIQDRRGVVGIIEIQSSAFNVFTSQDLETVALLGTQMAAKLEERWLLESGWLTQQVRECLRNLSDDVYLNHCLLADWLQIKDLSKRSQLLRQLLLDAIEHVLPEANISNLRTNRRYQILKQTYVDQTIVDLICENLSLSRRQYFYDLKQAIDVVVDFLFTQHENISLGYDVSVPGRIETASQQAS